MRTYPSAIKDDRLWLPSDSGGLTSGTSDFFLERPRKDSTKLGLRLTPASGICSPPVPLSEARCPIARKKLEVLDWGLLPLAFIPRRTERWYGGKRSTSRSNANFFARLPLPP